VCVCVCVCVCVFVGVRFYKVRNYTDVKEWSRIENRTSVV